MLPLATEKGSAIFFSRFEFFCKIKNIFANFVLKKHNFKHVHVFDFLTNFGEVHENFKIFINLKTIIHGFDFFS